MKTCSTCHEPKLNSAFYSDRRKRDGLASECRACNNAAHARSKAKGVQRPRVEFMAERQRLHEQGLKVCARCAETKPLTAFATLPYSGDGLAYACSDCLNAESRAYHAANLDKAHRSARAWKAAHPERTRELSRLAQRRNPEANQRRSMEWRAKTPDYRASIIAWNERNPDLAKAYIKANKARRRSALGSFTASEWVDLKDGCRNRCLCCGRPEAERKLTADHVLPLSKGGSNDIENIQPLCLPCNMRKRTQHIDYRGKSVWTGATG